MLALRPAFPSANAPTSWVKLPRRGPWFCGVAVSGGEKDPKGDEAALFVDGAGAGIATGAGAKDEAKKSFFPSDAKAEPGAEDAEGRGGPARA